MSTGLTTVLSDEVKTLLDHFGILAGVRIAFFDTRGQALEVGNSWPICEYCQLLRRDATMDRRCREEDRQAFDRVEKTRQMSSYTCHAGLRESVVPIESQGKLLGYLMIGQYRLQGEGEAERFDVGPASQELVEAFQKQKSFSIDEHEALLHFLKKLTEMIMVRYGVQLQGDAWVAGVVERLRQSPEKAWSLAEASRWVHRSPSTLSHALKRVTGKSFKKNQQDFRLEQAVRILNTHPEKNICQIAVEVGYADPLYFSRLFRKKYGVSPKASLK